jgi:hypothetical protein
MPSGLNSRITIITMNAAARPNSEGIQTTETEAVSPMMIPPPIAP